MVIITLKRIKAQTVNRSLTIYKTKTAKSEYKGVYLQDRTTAGSDRNRYRESTKPLNRDRTILDIDIDFGKGYQFQKNFATHSTKF